MSLFCEPKHVQCIKRKSGITQPRIPVIPVAYAAQTFWQRGSWSSDNRASWRIGHHFEYQRATFYPFGKWPLEGGTFKPRTPAVQRVGQFPIEVALVQFLLGKPASSFSIAPYTYSKQEAFALLQCCMHENRWMHFSCFM